MLGACTTMATVLLDTDSDDEQHAVAIGGQQIDEVERSSAVLGDDVYSDDVDGDVLEAPGSKRPRTAPAPFYFRRGVIQQ